VCDVGVVSVRGSSQADRYWVIVGVTVALVVVAVALTALVPSSNPAVVVPSPAPSASPTAVPSVKGPPTSASSTSVRCGQLTRYVAPTASSGGSIEILIPTDRRIRGGSFSLGILAGQPPATPSAWTCVRFIAGAPFSVYVAVVASGTEGYLPEPSPTPRGEYANQAFLYYLTLPDPYRKSEVLSQSFSGPDVASGESPATVEVLTARSVSEEQSLACPRSGTACPIWDYVAVVEYFTDFMTPRQWYAKRGGVGGETIEDLVIDGRTAIKVTNGGPYPVQLIVRDGNFMFRVGFQIYSTDPARAPTGASRAKLEQIVASFHFAG
jgi:hypothetical protein